MLKRKNQRKNGKVDLVLKFQNGLIPAIIQDEKTGAVLSLFYMDRAAVKQTKRTGYVWRFSRTYGKLMKKGATSGNTQRVVKINSDCEGKSLLVTVASNGPACHKGTISCYRRENFLFELEKVIESRKTASKKSSLTAFLLSKPAKLRAKILEEAFELVTAKTRKGVTWEAADLIFFSMVYCSSNGVPLQSVVDELTRRNAEKTRKFKKSNVKV